MLGTVQVGIKRKLDESSLFDKSYHDQRQSILNISMCKLKTFPKRRVEPSLLHSVLIFNTLRCIEHELREEGVSVNPAATPAFLPSIPSQDTVNSDPLPGADASSHNLEQHNTKLEWKGAQSVSNRTQICRTVSVTPIPMDTSSLDTASPISTRINQVQVPPSVSPKEQSSNVTKPAEVDINSNLSSCESMNTTLTEFSKLLAASQWTMNSNGNSGNGVATSINGFTASAMSTAASNFSTTASNFFSSNSSRLDYFFSDSDLDLSVYDFDLFSPISTNMRLTPLSAEELLHTFPSPTDPLVPFTNAGGSCKNDVHCDDLDHIMQVLVGI